jgi:hypothetical protein
LSDQPCENEINTQRFGDFVCLHHQGWHSVTVSSIIRLDLDHLEEVVEYDH